MSPVRIVTDSTADLPPELAEEMGIAVIPALVYVGSQVYRDGVDLTAGELRDRISGGSDRLGTSQPALGEFVAAYERLLEDPATQDILSIHVAGSLSGTVGGAWAASQMLPDPSRVEVIDSGQVSMGLGWVVLRAAEWARAGAGRAQVSAAVRALLPKVRVVAAVDSLDNLYRSGRISHLTAALGTVLHIKPVLTVAAGRVSILDKVRTHSRALARMVEHARGWGSLAALAVLHTGAEEVARNVAALLGDLAPPEQTMIAQAGAAVTTHLGLGVVGVCAVTESGQLG
jgi:DegV family protein with EDD domain